MNARKFDNVMAVFSAILLLIALILATNANAWTPKPKPDPAAKQTQTQKQAQSQDQYQGQQQQANSKASSKSVASSEAVNEGNSLSVNSEAGPADLVLVPNNNTETCLRVFGFAWGNKDASGMLGIPWRSGKCDYEQAADDAFAAGERETGWFWKCQNKNLYKRFRDEGESRDKAAEDCLARMVGPITMQRQYDALKDDYNFMMNEKKVEREQLQQTIQQTRDDCAESNERVLEACVSK